MSISLAETVRLMFSNALLVRQEEGAEIDLQVGRTVTKAPRYMRTQLWLGVLQRYPGLGNKAARQYNILLRKPVPELTADDIAKDVGRTFPNIPRFTTDAGKLRLHRLLRAYAVYDPEVNYCQGMNFLAALLLIWMPTEAEAFGALVVVMQERGLRELYKKDMTTLQARLWQIGKLLPHSLAEHLENNAVLPVLYASSWLLTAFSADFPLFWSSRVMDVILTDCYIEPMMKVVLGIMNTCKPALMQSNDMESMVRYIKVGAPRWPHATLQEVLTDSLAMEWTAAQSAVLGQTEGTETVVDAVKRVQKLNQEGQAAAFNSQNGTSEDSSAHLIASSRAPLRTTSLSWASRLSTPVSLSSPTSTANPSELPPARQQHAAQDQSDVLQPSASDWLDISTSPSRSTSARLSEGATAVAPASPSQVVVYRPTNEAPISSHPSLTNRSSTGSFGDFTGFISSHPPGNESQLSNEQPSSREPLGVQDSGQSDWPWEDCTPHQTCGFSGAEHRERAAAQAPLPGGGRGPPHDHAERLARRYVPSSFIASEQLSFSSYQEGRATPATDHCYCPEDGDEEALPPLRGGNVTADPQQVAGSPQRQPIEFDRKRSLLDEDFEAAPLSSDLGLDNLLLELSLASPQMPKRPAPKDVPRQATSMNIVDSRLEEEASKFALSCSQQQSDR